jgi:hypothetical protein
MRRVLARITAVLLLMVASGKTTELTIAPVREAPRPQAAQIGLFSGSVNDALGKRGSGILAKDLQFRKAARPKAIKREFEAILRGSIVDWPF